MPTISDPLLERLQRLRAARLYLICDSAPAGRDLRDLLAPAIAGGVDVVQLREKHLEDDELARSAYRTAQLCRELGVLFIVNDRPDVALAAGADGVHIGQADMPVAQARGLVGAQMLIGLSTHTPAEIDAADSAAAERAQGQAAARSLAPGHGGADDSARDNPRRVDYIGVGPVYATPTKPGRRATGLDLVRYAAAHAALPFFAIGGIHAGNCAAVVAAGAQRLAVVRAIAQAPSPERAARELRGALDGA